MKYREFLSQRLPWRQPLFFLHFFFTFPAVVHIFQHWISPKKINNSAVAGDSAARSLISVLN
jgi:uncharacterized membrane protein (DUF485 family)